VKKILNGVDSKTAVVEEVDKFFAAKLEASPEKLRGIQGELTKDQVIKARDTIISSDEFIEALKINLESAARQVEDLASKTDIDRVLYRGIVIDDIDNLESAKFESFSDDPVVAFEFVKENSSYTKTGADGQRVIMVLRSGKYDVNWSPKRLRYQEWLVSGANKIVSKTQRSDGVWIVEVEQDGS
jgi:antitoxin component HigA of HigAB toxin-antitoxin module